MSLRSFSYIFARFPSWVRDAFIAAAVALPAAAAWALAFHLIGFR